MQHVRRKATAVIAALALLAACGGDDDPAPGGTTTTGAATGPHVVDTEFGPVEVPADPATVVALDEYAALNALALGVEPALVFASFQSVVGGEVLTDAGIEVVPGSAEAGPNFEAIAAADPDLILFTTEGAWASNFEELSAIAPSVSMPYDTPWRDVVAFTAEVLDRGAEADVLVAAVESRLAELQAALADDPQSLSILGSSMGLHFGVSSVSPLARIVDEAGFTRPAAQADGAADEVFTSAVPLSLETLGDHDADTVAVLSGAYYDQDVFLEAPTFQALPSVAAGRSVVVDGDLWFGTYPFAVYWLLEDLAAIHAGAGQDGIGTVEDAPARLAAFDELVAG